MPDLAGCDEEDDENVLDLVVALPSLLFCAKTRFDAAEGDDGFLAVLSSRA